MSTKADMAIAFHDKGYITVHRQLPVRFVRNLV